MVDLFSTVANYDKLSKGFLAVKDSYQHEAARKMFNQIFNSIKQIDKNFIEQFQTHGFDARVWELYLTAVFQNFGFDIKTTHNRPDFELEKNGTKIFVEATVSKNTKNEEIEDKWEIIQKDIHNEEKWLSMMSELAEFSLIRMANSLYSKLNKKYWEREWVKGHPIILAIEPFHHALSLLITDSMLPEYLYGIDQNWYYDENGKLIINTKSKKSISHKEKEIPAGFFYLPEASYISAVIFSNSGTTAKFSRMGKLNGFGQKDVIMKRTGACYVHDPDQSIAQKFEYIVGVNGPEERWEQGLTMFHNPYAKYPIDREFFPNIVHGYYEHNFYAMVPDFHPFNSHTELIKLNNK